jgi:hypothetical protein
MYLDLVEQIFIELDSQYITMPSIPPLTSCAGFLDADEDAAVPGEVS